MNLFDEYHDNLCKILLDTSNSIDDYFIEGNSTLSSTTYAEFSMSFAKETYLEMEKDIRFKLRLNLPKIQENLRLVFEDENSDNLLYDGTNLKDEKLKDKRYYLRLEYFRYIKDSLNIRSNYKLINQNDYKSEIYNRLRYYSDGEIENNFEFNSLGIVRDDLYMSWNNNLYYINEESLQILYNDVTLVSVINEKQQFNVGLGISSTLEEFSRPTIEYYYLHSSFQNLFYKDWVYYELAPSILKRRTNNFKTSYRFLVNFGIYFKND